MDSLEGAVVIIGITVRALIVEPGSCFAEIDVNPDVIFVATSLVVKCRFWTYKRNMMGLIGISHEGS